jgi:antitoxin (DNA-binding transcriptional repressor) of toxin-antitoxin stability system
MSIRELNQNLSKAVSEAEAGEVIVIRRNGRAVAELRAHHEDRTQDPNWQAAYKALCDHLDNVPVTGLRVDDLTEEDKYGPSKW